MEWADKGWIYPVIINFLSVASIGLMQARYFQSQSWPSILPSSTGVAAS
jgi:hypothetical protein